MQQREKERRTTIPSPPRSPLRLPVPRPAEAAPPGTPAASERTARKRTAFPFGTRGTARLRRRTRRRRSERGRRGYRFRFRSPVGRLLLLLLLLPLLFLLLQQRQPHLRFPSSSGRTSNPSGSPDSVMSRRRCSGSGRWRPRRCGAGRRAASCRGCFFC